MFLASLREWAAEILVSGGLVGGVEAAVVGVRLPIGAQLVAEVPLSKGRDPQRDLLYGVRPSEELLGGIDLACGQVRQNSLKGREGPC
ncbi:hypothetical protein QEH56_23745 [Pelagicoccus enzymogenes]|uniref:hypothetical protein n=1 Tax=Pelagicoccus enzymogenes TaxID=2773457 RepID=UPI00280F0EA1|nr:hypothetical protein [Pelagicoccus enzymogenes]MDQ8201199.1 hypothetical protein [Pelagicoccus enzymogenes]